MRAVVAIYDITPLSLYSSPSMLDRLCSPSPLIIDFKVRHTTHLLRCK